MKRNTKKQMSAAELAAVEDFLAKRTPEASDAVTEHIDSKHYLAVRRRGMCLACGAMSLRQNGNQSAAGSLFLMCTDCQWYIGFRMAVGRGEQARVARWQETRPICGACGEVGEREGHMGCQYPRDRG